MKLRNILTGITIALAMNSCIQDEALNVEAAIDGCSGANIQLLTINEISRAIDVYVFEGADISAQELNFQLADGSTIQPDEKAEKDNPPYYDFSQNRVRQFTVTSEDGSNKVTYTINLTVKQLPLEFSFENLREITPYHILYLTDSDGFLQWSSGNPGYKFCGMATNANQYPTVQTNGGKEGKCITLTTLSTGSFGSMTTPKMPIAAGNLFIGSFDAQYAIKAPRQATKFGFPFTHKPTKISGYYKYKPGPQMTNQAGEAIPGTDTGDIYAALYEAESSNFFLDGDLFPLDGSMDKSIVSLARIDKTQTTDQWTKFELDFKPQNGKTIDEEKLKSGKYKLAIVFSSSIKGAYFEGAEGSQLCVDEVKITCEE